MMINLMNNGYNERDQFILGRTFKGLILPMLKDLIRGRVMSSGYPSVSAIIRNEYYHDIDYNSRPNFKFDQMYDFRLALRIISENKLRDRNKNSCFSATEAILCNKLRVYGNKFVHSVAWPPGFLSDVLMTTHELLSILKTDKNINFRKYKQILEDIKIMVSSRLSLRIAQA